MKTIRFAQLSDAPALLSIYAHYVENSVITFEYDVPSLEEFDTGTQYGCPSDTHTHFTTVEGKLYNQDGILCQQTHQHDQIGRASCRERV